MTYWATQGLVHQLYDPYQPPLGVVPIKIAKVTIKIVILLFKVFKILEQFPFLFQCFPTVWCQEEDSWDDIPSNRKSRCRQEGSCVCWAVGDQIGDGKSMSTGMASTRAKLLPKDFFLKNNIKVAGDEKITWLDNKQQGNLYISILWYEDIG